MNRTRHKRAARFSLVLLAVLIAAPLGLTWRQVRQERLNQALIAAVKRNDDRAAVSLLNEGADANCRDEPPRKFSLWETLMQVVRGRRSPPSDAPTPLRLALEPRGVRDQPDGSSVFVFPPENLPLARALLNHGAQVNQMQIGGMTPLKWAIIGGMNTTIRLLLAREANVNARMGHPKGIYSDGPLVWAVCTNTLETGVIADLMDRVDDVNERDYAGKTALVCAVDRKRVDVVRLLLARHADMTLHMNGTGLLPEMLLVKDRRYGKTPLALALEDKSAQGRQIVRLLKAAGAKK